jgi:hypothetical protein
MNRAACDVSYSGTGRIERFLESAIRGGYQDGMRREAFSCFAAALTASAQVVFAPAALAGPHDELIARHAAANGVPEHLVRRVIRIESRGNAASVYRGNYGLMQIRLGTARGVGYSGEAKGLLDPDTNLTYAVKYLAGAYRAAGCDADRAVRYYQRGYYGTAQRSCGVVLPTTVVAANPADVIKPKVVRTEIIATPKSGQAPARPVGKFEPARVAPPPAPPVVVSNPPAKLEAASTSDISKAEPAKLELASIPMPRVRPEFDPAVKQPVARVERTHKRVDKKLMVAVRSGTESKPAAETKSPADGPAAVVTFLKKLVTPDKTTRKPAAEAQADPPSQVQPIQ